MGFNYFTYNGISSRNYNIVITAQTTHTLAERDITVKSVPGRNGDLLLDNGRYNNVIISYTCAVIPSENFRHYNAQIEEIKDWLKGDTDYNRLSDSYNALYFRYARISGQVEFTLNKLIYEFTVTFDCQPQMYYFSGDTFLQVDSGTSIRASNPSNEIAYPLIVISGNNNKYELDDKITIDNSTFSFLTWTGEDSANGENYKNDIIIDLDLQDVYLSDGTPILRLLNTTGDVPSIGIGTHTIGYIGNNTMRFKWRWWKV